MFGELGGGLDLPPAGAVGAAEDRQPAAAFPVGEFGEFAVGVEVVGEPAGDRGQVVRVEAQRVLDQRHLRGGALDGLHGVGQVLDRVDHDPGVGR